MPYDYNGYAIDQDNAITLRKVVFAVVAALLVIGIVSYIVNDFQADEPKPTYYLEFDCSNAAQMHEYGLPTKADVIEYHVFGRWCTNDGEVHVYQELPGGADPWDELYKIQDNPKFVK